MKCQGHKKNGDPCTFKAQKGFRTCKQHEYQLNEIIRNEQRVKEEPQVERIPSVSSNERVLKMHEFFKKNPVEKITFCCDYHKDIVVDILARNTVSLKQVDYISAIIAGKANHRNQPDLNKVHTIRCAKWDCECRITGTAIELGTRRNLCDEHGNS